MISPETLAIHNIDLHYHAGQERQPGTTLEGYLEHAVMTGRRLVGLTDHLEKYIGRPLSAAQTPPLYEQSVAGLEAYRADVERLRARFPTLALLFGPEIHAGRRIVLRAIPQRVVDVSDYFLASLPTDETSVAADTEAKIRRVDDIAALRERTDRPVFVAHPFRAAVDHRLVKRPIEPWVTVLAPRPAHTFADTDVERFFGFDVRAFGRACRACALPVEINGGTDSRVRGLNLPAPLQMLWAAYRILQQEGVTFVPGSDQHEYMRASTRREGRYIPFDAFAELGVTAQDILFVSQLVDRRRKTATSCPGSPTRPAQSPTG